MNEEKEYGICGLSYRDVLVNDARDNWRIRHRNTVIYLPKDLVVIRYKNDCIELESLVSIITDNGLADFIIRRFRK